ncbi:MAG: TonB-dependent receptor [Hahellaceae bacterium]|nr:TonB-dependent receptor [Hahellaceae bacterium]
MFFQCTCAPSDRHTRLLSSFFLIGFTSLSFTSSAQPQYQPDDQGEAFLLAASDYAQYAQLLEILDQETEIATKTRLNSDYVPGMVTLLNGREMEALGKKTVWQALALVPGIQIRREGNGNPILTIRDAPFNEGSGNVKVMINSVAMGRESAGINSSIMLMPIEEIERIEVVRGPGSALYGDFAYMGLINIITRKSDNGVFARYDSHHAATSGGFYHWASDDQRWYGSINLSGALNQRAETNNNLFSEEQQDEVAFALGFQKTELRIQSFRRDLTDDQTRESHQSYSLSHQFNPTPDLTIDSHFNYLRNDFRSRPRKFEGDSYDASLDVHWTGWRYHAWSLGLNYIYANIDNASWLLPALPSQGSLPTPGGLTPSPLVPGNSNTISADVNNQHWQQTGVSLQDQIELSPTVNLIAGVRVDHRDDINDSQISPRVGALWQVAEKHVLKAQYSEGFRAPTFFEIHSNQVDRESLVFASNQTYELGYIYRTTNLVARSTLFYADMDHLSGIKKDPANQIPTFASERKGNTLGAELELEQQLFDTLKIMANFSYAKAKTSFQSGSPYEQNSGAAGILSNLALHYQPWQDFALTSHWNHVADRYSRAGDIASYDTLDLTANFFNVGVSGLSVRTGVNNLLNDKIVYVFALPDRDLIQTFPERYVWVQVSYAL